MLPNKNPPNEYDEMPGPLQTETIHHLSFVVKDVEKLIQFYREVMGFQLLKRPDMKFPGAWLFKDGLQIHLIGGQDYDPNSPENISSRHDHFAFHTNDFEGTEQLLKDHNIEYRVNVQGGSGLKQLFFHDPEGHTLEIANYPTPTILED